jgi:hypothetical protein
MTFKVLTTIFQWAKAEYSYPEEVTAPNRLYLPFLMQNQIMDNWCWAAVASSVAFYFDDTTPWTQVELAAKAFDYLDDDVPDADWDRPFPLGEAFGFVGCLGRVHLGQTTFHTVVGELRHGRPVCLQIQWDSKEGHAVAITGCWVDSMGLTHYRVDDPGLWAEDYGKSWDEEREIPERKLMKRYRKFGTWCNTFLVTTPKPE